MSDVLIADADLEVATPEQVERYIRYLRSTLGDWRQWARPEQVAPEEFSTMYVRGGRGSGKTWTGSNNFAEMILAAPPGEWAVIAPTYGDARDTCMESAESGLIKALGGRAGPGGVLLDAGPHIVSWNRSMGDLRLRNGAVVYADGADDGALRVQGKNLRGAWCDEVGLWKRWRTAWDESIRYAVRLSPARIIATGTPKRTMPARELIRRLLDDPTVECRLLLTEDNIANLHPEAVARLMLLKGTAQGRQELEGELVDDIDGAMWSLEQIDAGRCSPDVVGDLSRVVTAIDPAVTSGENADESGIVAAGVSDPGWCQVCGALQDGVRHGFVLADESCRVSPDQWCRRAVDLHDRVAGDCIVAEVNNGGDLVETVLRTVDVGVPYRKVTASRGKRTRAEPIAALYEQGRVHHVGTFPELEDQMCSWTPDSGESPDRMDALVWCLTDLLVEPPKRRRELRAA